MKIVRRRMHPEEKRLRAFLIRNNCLKEFEEESLKQRHLNITQIIKFIEKERWGAFKYVIDRSLNWSLTKQGGDFWNKLHIKYQSEYK